MKNKDKKLIIILAAIFVFAAVVASAFLVIDICKNKDVTEPQQLPAIVDSDAIDFQHLAETAWGNSKVEDEPEFLKKFDEKSTFTFLTYTQEENGYYTVTFEITSPNINAALKKLDSELDISLLTEKEISAKICEVIDSSDLLTSSQTAIVIVDEEGTARIKFTQGFVDAMYGYVYNDAFESLSNVLS